MKRRSYLGAVSAATVVSLAGCTSAFGSDPSESVVLPEQEDQAAASDQLDYPAYGQKLPDFRLKDPLRDEWVDTEEIDRTELITAIFTYCPQECLVITRSLAEVQYMVNENGLKDDVVFLAITFDPERDDAEALAEHAEVNQVDLEAGNWHYLRPEDAEEAKRVVQDRLGIAYERTDESERLDTYDFIHMIITFLVNPDGYVERTYWSERIDIDRVFEDVQTVTNAY